jgi:hypothetical protein
MNVVESRIGISVMALLVAGTLGYLPVLLSHGNTIIPRLFHLYVGLLVGALATTGHLANAAAFSSVITAVVIAGTGAAFLAMAYRGNKQITDLVRRVKAHGEVTIG